MGDEAKTGNAKLGAAVVGGYMLGRFKKGRQAMRLAAYLNGGQTPPEMLIGSGRQGVSKVLANDQAKEIIEQVKGPLAEALQGMLIAQVSSRVQNLSNGLESRTAELNKQANAITTTATDTAGGAADKGKGALGKLTDKVRGRDKDKSKQDEEDTDAEEPSDSDSTDESTESAETGETDESTETGGSDEPTDSGEEGSEESGDVKESARG